MIGTVGEQVLLRHCSLHMNGPKAMALVTLAWLAVGPVWLIVGADPLGRGASRLASAIGTSPLALAWPPIFFTDNLIARCIEPPSCWVRWRLNCPFPGVGS